MVYEIIIILVMLAVNAVFAAYEMALASTPRARLSTLCQRKKKGAEEAAYMKDRMEASLAVVQLGITLAGAIAAATGGAGVQGSFTPFFVKIGIPANYAEVISLVCLVIPLSAFTIIFAELVPKMFALENRESVCLALSPAMKAITWIAGPAVSFFEDVVKKILDLSPKKAKEGTDGDKQSLHELKAAVALARTSRLIGSQEEKIVLSAAQLSQREVSEIMLDAGYISMIPVTDKLSEALIKAHLDMHTRFPVCEKERDPQTIVGYINFKDIVSALKINPEDPSVRGIARPIKKIPEITPISHALSEMMRENAHIVLVVSLEDKVLGLMTLEDIIEELVGNIEDEFDRLSAYVQLCGAGWIMGGGVPMKTVALTLGAGSFADDMTERTPTLAGWVEQMLGRDIKAGEVLSFDDFSVAVRKLRRGKLAEALVVKVTSK